MYQVFKEEDRYDPLLDISPFPTLGQLKDFTCGIHHFVTFVGKWFSESNLFFALTITQDNMYYSCINDNERWVINGYKEVLKAVLFYRTENNTSLLQK